MSAMYYAMTKVSFEEIALKFVQIDDTHALKIFLEKVIQLNLMSSLDGEITLDLM